VPTGEEFTVEADTVVIAIGYGTDAEIVETADGIDTNQWSQVAVNTETFETSRAGVFAGGDCVNGADLVVTALADGRRAAQTIHEYLHTLPAKRASAITGLTS
jgi:glutamate synthase (NADPH/NADH) small chain